MDTAATLDSFVQSARKPLLDFLGRLIALESPSTREKAVAETVKDEMTRLGYHNVRFDGVGNVIGELGQGEKCVLLSAHMDVSGAGDRSRWSFDPWSGSYDDETIRGRGAGDNKGALAAMVYGSWIWHRMNSKAGYRVLVGGTVLEEDADGYGMQSLLDELPVKPAAVLVGKPTNGNVYRGHRGRMEVRIEVQGVGCHGSTPEKGKNALYLAGRVLIALEKLSGALREDPFLGKATLAATALDVFPGKFNQVPEKVVICVDRRLTAGETDSSAIDEIKAALPYPEVAVSCFPYSNTAWTGKEIRLDKYFPSWVLPESHPLVGAALEAGRLAFGRDLLLGKWTVSTDGVGSMGRHGIPTVGYGPGERRAVDDMQNIVDLVDALKFYSTFCHTVRTVA
jgi:putative selenium metabolism hydrolase